MWYRSKGVGIAGACRRGSLLAALGGRSTGTLGRKGMSTREFQFHHPVGVEISRNITEAQLLAAVPEVAASKHDMRTGYIWYRLPPFKDADLVVGVGLCFRRGVLDSISLAAVRPGQESGWSAWSNESEIAAVESTAKWFTERGFPPGAYPWGTVWVGRDIKTGDGGGSIRFVT